MVMHATRWNIIIFEGFILLSNNSDPNSNCYQKTSKFVPEKHLVCFPKKINKHSKHSTQIDIEQIQKYYIGESIVQ